jgi:hypothetical protein
VYFPPAMFLMHHFTECLSSGQAKIELVRSSELGVRNIFQFKIKVSYFLIYELRTDDSELFFS